MKPTTKPQRDSMEKARSIATVIIVALLFLPIATLAAVIIATVRMM